LSNKNLHGMGWACSTRGEKRCARNADRILVGKFDWKKPAGRIRTSGRFLLTWQ
jgi:hypothetical protein